MLGAFEGLFGRCEAVSRFKGIGVVVGMRSGSLTALLSDGGGHSGSGGNRFSFSNSLDVGVYPLAVPFELVLPRNFCRKARIVPPAWLVAS